MAYVALNKIAGKLTNINTSSMTADEVLERITELKKLIFSKGKEKRENLYKIAEIASCGEHEKEMPDDSVYTETFTYVDVEMLDENQLKERYNVLKEMLTNLSHLYEFGVISGYALTGVPF